ncbi:VWA domain-containing protein [Hungatella sp.]|uniref:DUF7604 domain-containing protein n=1 Tax=Hungatella sp. TaxID=2613924 RepID=UPI002A827309|nr:VWA domain-containing protein [Hungatella sp.]
MNRQFYEKHKKRRLEKLWRRSLAWLLTVCICLGNVNIAAFAAESVGTGGTGATPSNAKKENSATPSNADRTASEIWLPDGMMKGAELLEEAERAVTNDYRFDFNNLMKMIDAGNPDEEDDEAEDESDTGSAERYKKLFKGYDSFTLFYDNGKFGRLGGDSEEAYAYILVRVPKETYHAYLTGEDSVRIATASEADAAEGGYKLKGDEDIIFLYVNAGEQDVSFYLNLEDVEAGEVTVPNADAIWEEPDKPDKPEVSLPAEGGVNGNPAESADPDAAADPGKNKDEANPENPAPDRNEEIGENEESGGVKETVGTQENGGKAEAGGTQESGGKVEAGGTQESGGKVEDGGTQENGGRSEAGGTQENGGKAEAGGTQESGGKVEAGGKQETGEQQEAGGTQENGGKAEAGGKQESGGKAEAGVAQENGGRSEAGVAQEKVGKSEAGGIQEGGGKSEAGGTQESGEKQEAGGTRESGGEQEAGGKQENGGKAEAGGTQESGGKAEHGAAQENSGKLKAGGKQENTGKPEAGGSQENTGKQEAWRTQKTINTAENDTQNLEEKSNAAAKTELKISGSRHNVFTLMEPLADEEELNESEDEMTFEEWQAMIGDDQDEDEYDDSDNAVYDEEEGIIHLSLNVLPAAVAEVKKEQPKRNFFSRALFKAQDTTERAVLQASVTSVSNLVPKVSGAHKQIEYKGGDLYRLHLDIAGGGAPLGIVLVIDTSASMNYAYGNNQTRLGKLKEVLGYTANAWDTADGFVDKVLEKNPETKFSIVTFNEYGKTVLNWTNNKNTIKSSIGELKANEGTNCEDGLWYANTQLQTLAAMEEGYVPCMIFLGDGAPTYYMGASNRFEGGKGTRNGNGKSDRSTETINAANIFRSWNTGLNTYAVNIGGDAKKDVLEAITGDQKKVISASQSDNLVTAFDLITNSMKMKMKNVTIEDTLSEYVDLPGGNLKSADVTVMADEMELSDNEYNISYHSDSKKITLDLSKATSDRILDSDTLYSLSFNIKVNAHARNVYKENNGYLSGMTGDPDTDYKGNSTSAGKAGFYSNKEAKVLWSGSETGYTYPQPVVQVPYEPEHRKHIKDNEDGTYNLTLDVESSQSSSSSTVTTKNPADVIFVLDKSKSMQYVIDKDSNAGRGEESRADIINEAMKKSLTELNSSEYDIQFAGYQFAGRNYSYSWPYGYYYDTKQITFGYESWTGKLGGNNPFEITPTTTANGTAPGQALEGAANLLNSGSTDAHRENSNLQRYVIFLTDGKPEGISGDTIDVEKASYTAASKIGKNLSNVKFYAIKVSKNVPDTYINKLIEYLPENVTSKVWPGTTKTEIQKALDEIKADIISSTTTQTYGVMDVTITDELSEYADFAVTDETDVRLTRDGVLMTEEEYRSIIQSVVKTERTDTENPKITVTFNPSYELEAGVRYGVTFQVKPSKAAYDTYKANSNKGEDGYGGMTGDPGTDTAGNDTSSNKPGFRTNTSATLHYQWGDYTGILPYDHPVLQVKRGKLRVQKIVDNLAGTDIGDDRFLIHLRDENGTYVSVVLRAGEMSPYIYTDSLLTLTISESVPMEYRKSVQFLKVSENGGTPVLITDNTVTVGPGDDLVLEIHNEVGHKTYFHGDDLVTNHTTGDPEDPFTSAAAQSENYLLEQTAAPVDPGKRDIEFKELGEDDALV